MHGTDRVGAIQHIIGIRSPVGMRQPIIPSNQIENFVKTPRSFRIYSSPRKKISLFELLLIKIFGQHILNKFFKSCRKLKTLDQFITKYVKTIVDSGPEQEAKGDDGST